MKITIYELLGLIKDGKAPEKIKYKDYYWEWADDDYKTIKLREEKFLITGVEYDWLMEFLNDEVEIIEEDKEIEKLITLSGYDSSSMSRHYEKINEICDKINDLIDEVNKLNKN